MAWLLGHRISSPRVLDTKSLSGTKVDSVFHPSEVDQISTRTPGDLIVKLSPYSESVDLIQLLNPIKRGHKVFK